MIQGTAQFPVVTVASYSHPCSYLPGREATMEFTFAHRMPATKFQRLLELGFRRSGTMVYRPACSGCRECQPIRVLAQEFRANRSMRRNWRDNQDLIVTVGNPAPSRIKFELYRRYLETRHDSSEYAGFEDFLYQSPVETLEIEFRLANELVCVAISDLVPSGLSTVYCYFDPALKRRGLGTFSILSQLDFCRRQGWPHCYLGFYVRDCRKMNYKNRFLPHELLGPDGAWRRNTGMQQGPVTQSRSC